VTSTTHRLLDSYLFVLPSEHFNTVLYTGNGGTQSISSLSFQPDFVWGKDRVGTDNHHLFDILRGTNQRLISNQTAAENTEINCLNSFDTNGFTLGSNTGLNANGEAHVAWNWKANGAGVSNTSGSITSTVSANADAGFSIVSYTGTGSAGTVGHGLSKAPDLVIQKGRSYADSWHVGSTALSYTSGDFMRLNNTAAVAQNTNIWSSTAPTNTVFSLGADGGVNGSGSTNIAYCFHSVDGHSKVGSYTGNGSTDGTFVYTGFRPAWVLFRKTSSGEEWGMFDSDRDTYNAVNKRLRPHSSAGEGGGNVCDFTSNGIKLRTTDGQQNGSGSTYIFLAFAENPFKHTNAR